MKGEWFRLASKQHPPIAKKRLLIVMRPLAEAWLLTAERPSLKKSSAEQLTLRHHLPAEAFLTEPSFEGRTAEESLAADPLSKRQSSMAEP